MVMMIFFIWSGIAFWSFYPVPTFKPWLNKATTLLAVAGLAWSVSQMGETYDRGLKLQTIGFPLIFIVVLIWREYLSKFISDDNSRAQAMRRLDRMNMRGYNGLQRRSWIGLSPGGDSGRVVKILYLTFFGLVAFSFFVLQVSDAFLIWFVLMLACMTCITFLVPTPRFARPLLIITALLSFLFFSEFLVAIFGSAPIPDVRFERFFFEVDWTVFSALIFGLCGLQCLRSARLWGL
ncbi:MAG: hypothetical protein AAF442_06275 [Pseudomonadota bacterium]